MLSTRRSKKGAVRSFGGSGLAMKHLVAAPDVCERGSEAFAAEAETDASRSAPEFNASPTRDRG
jgi:hypothetical protein